MILLTIAAAAAGRRTRWWRVDDVVDSYRM